jgi:hypothetical protein
LFRHLCFYTDNPHNPAFFLMFSIYMNLKRFIFYIIVLLAAFVILFAFL